MYKRSEFSGVLGLFVAAFVLLGAGRAESFEFLFGADREYLNQDNGGEAARRRCLAEGRSLTVYSRRFVRPPHYEIKTTPRRFAYRRRRVMVSPPRLERRLVRGNRYTTVRRPARYRRVEQLVLVRHVKYHAIRRAGRTAWRGRQITVRNSRSRACR